MTQNLVLFHHKIKFFLKFFHNKSGSPSAKHGVGVCILLSHSCFHSCLFTGESIPIYADIENCSSRLIVPKAVIYQTQTYLAGGKTRCCRQVLASVRGNHVASGSSDAWNGKPLKIPPVSPSILNSAIIRVEYSLAVSTLLSLSPSWGQRASCLAEAFGKWACT